MAIVCDFLQVMLMFSTMDKERKFLPAGLIISAGILIVGGLALGAIGTPLLALKGDITLSLRTGIKIFSTSLLTENYAALFFKEIIGLALILAGIGLVRCKEAALTTGTGLLALTGIAMPLFIKLEMSKIEAGDADNGNAGTD